MEYLDSVPLSVLEPGALEVGHYVNLANCRARIDSDTRAGRTVFPFALSFTSPNAFQIGHPGSTGPWASRPTRGASPTLMMPSSLDAMNADEL